MFAHAIATATIMAKMFSKLPSEMFGVIDGMGIPIY
jgi:hypothetical protein